MQKHIIGNFINDPFITIAKWLLFSNLIIFLNKFKIGYGNPKTVFYLIHVSISKFDATDPKLLNYNLCPFLNYGYLCINAWNKSIADIVRFTPIGRFTPKHNQQ